MSDSKSWGASIREELGFISKILIPIGFSIGKDQPHISGERFLMTKEKLVLVGERIADKKKVIIKISKHHNGQEEIRREKNIRDTLARVAFASEVILLPDEIYFGGADGYLLWVSEFIEQDQVFATKPVEEQFFLSLNIFEMQEGFHANTFENLRTVHGVFPIFNAETYINSFSGFKEFVSKRLSDNPKIIETLSIAEDILRSNKKVMEKYCGYLTHTDFAPANTRVSGRDIYMIDLSSVLFGNKYEGWARFLNWALIHSPKLENLLMDYVRKNRGEEEYLCLRLMRIYQVGFLIKYYAGTLEKTSGDLHSLNQKRIKLWSYVLQSLLEDQPISAKTLEEYRGERNQLRSKEETERQKEFNIPTL